MELVSPLMLATTDELNSRHDEIPRSMEQSLLSPISFLADGSCRNAETWTDSYLIMLSCSGLSPFSSSFPKKSGSRIVKDFETLLTKTRGQSGCTRWQCKACSGGELGIYGPVGSRLAVLFNSELGLCLDCVKSGRKSNVEGKCRYRHE